MSKTVTTFCRICIAGCGIEVTMGNDNRIQRIATDKENPHTWRDFCAKGRTANELIEHPTSRRDRPRRSCTGPRGSEVGAQSPPLTTVIRPLARTR